MNKIRLLFLTLLLILAISACNFFAPPADLQTENLQSDLARTQIADIRSTATIDAERLAITAEFAAESIRAAEAQGTRIASTLVASGILVGEIPIEAVMSQGTPIPAGGITPGASAAAQPSIPAIRNPLITPGFEGASARGDATILAPTATALVQSGSGSANSNGATLTNIQVSTDVGADDCPISATTSFSPAVVGIYVAAVGVNVDAANVISSRWLNEGTEVAFYEWTPGFDIDGACIWFYLPSESVTISSGSWTVQLAIDGIPVSSPVAFTVTSA